LGDAFYRWDGFRYHSSFYEFLPSVALAAILWCVTAIFLSLLIWILLIFMELSLQLRKRKLKSEHIFLFVTFSTICGILVWVAKRFIFDLAGSTTLFKFLVIISLFFTSVFLTWLLRNKFNVIQEKITPLVWLFGSFTVISIPLVAYNTWWIQTDDVAPKTINKYSSALTDRPNIILITFDSLTVENMSLYGYDRLTTPFITRWAKEATIFTRAESASTWTPPSVASLMLGKRVWTHQLYHSEGSHPVKSDIENLPLLLEKNGYSTMALIHNQLHASPKILGISRNFHFAPLETELKISAGILDEIDRLLYNLFFNKIKMYDWILKGDFILNTLVSLFFPYGETVTPFQLEKTFNRFLNVIGHEIQEPFFAWIHLYPPHYPYLPPEPFMGMFDASSGYRTSNSQSDLIMVSTPVISRRRPKEDVHAVVDTLRSRYDEFIRYSDKQFEDFVEQLQKRDKLKNTVIILSSDHGESFEHNYVGHDGNFYEEQTHIPLIIKEPNQADGMIVNELVEQIDITATILDIAHIDIPLWIEGRSLVPLIRGKTIPSTLVFSMNFQDNPSRGHLITKGGIAVWNGDYKLIQCLGCNTKPLLFNLKEDPEELHNLIDEKPGTGQQLSTLIIENLRKANEKIGDED
jgi:arylsulfatase A-like enzyme